MRPDGSDLRRLTENQWEDSTPAWKPGRRRTPLRLKYRRVREKERPLAVVAARYAHRSVATFLHRERVPITDRNARIYFSAKTFSFAFVAGQKRGPVLLSERTGLWRTVKL
jgi:hypothetical protein